MDVTQPRDANAPPDTPSTLGPSLALGGALVAAKALLLDRPESFAWAGQLAASTWQDVLFAAAFGLAGLVVLRAARHRPVARRWCWRAFVVAGALNALFTVVHVGVYEWSRRALSVQMLRFAGDVGNLRSSLTARLTWINVLALVLVPTLFVVVFRKPRPAASKWQAGAALVLSAVWALAGRGVLHRAAPEWLLRMSQNPHVALARSVVEEARGAGAVALPRDFRADDLEEFRIVGERARPPAVPPAARVRNVIVVVLESTGARHLGLYGSPVDAMPKLTAEAANALVVDAAYANVGLTVCTFQVIAFSVLPGLPWCYVPCGDRPLPKTLAELLVERGYRTALLSSADMNYEGMAWEAEHHGYQVIRNYWDLDCTAQSSWGAEDSCLFDGLLRFADEKPDQPFFALAWTSQAHDPYVVSREDQGLDFGPPGTRADRSRYLRILSRVDEGLARLFAGLRERGRDRDTLVVIVGDHGEAFAEPHGYVGHGGVLYDESIRVPLVLWSPALFAGAGRSMQVTSHVDLNPTLADLLGVPPAAGWQGHSLFDSARPDRAYFFAALGDLLFGVREGSRKYVYSASRGQESVYDLRQDPDETRDLSADDPSFCGRQRERIAAWIAYEEHLLKGTPLTPRSPQP